MSKVNDFLTEAGVFYLATVDGDQPKVRPLGAHFEMDGKILFGVGDFKEVYRQLLANPKVEIACAKPDGHWLRYTGRAVFETDPKYAEASLEAMPMLKNIYNEKSAAPGTIKLKLANNAVSLAPPAFAALVKLASDLEADTGCHDLHVTSAHRTVAEQQQVWDYYLAERGEEYCNDYVAKPGYSEHNTGLACDLSFFTDEGASVSIADSEFRG